MGRVSDYRVDHVKGIYQKTIGNFAGKKDDESSKKKKKPLK